METDTLWLKRTTAVLAAALVLTSLLALNSTPLPSPTPAAVVEMTNTLTFTPSAVTIEAGQTIEWRNTSLLAHTVTADTALATMEGSALLPDGAAPFHSGTMQESDTFRHTFETPGTYRYFCVPHEGAKMRGTVVVE